MLKKLLFIYFFLIIVLNIFFISAISAQEKYTISGYVKDASSGESLIGASVYIKESLKGTTTNQYGFYSLTLKQDNYNFVVSFIGYNDYIKKINLNKNLKINVSLKENIITTKEVVIKGERSDKNVQSTEVGTFQLPVKKIKELPAFLGEVDILKTIQLSPGVQSSGEGVSGIYVRGGGPDQNLILLDEAVVYNASHLFGFFSVFNADAIKNINLIKGGIPANYGGRLSSVLDISMKEGNNRKYEVDGGIGLISSRLTVQGPIKKDTSSFIISARRTYIDILIKPFIKKTSPFKGSGYYFYDINTKVNYTFSDKDRIFLSGYFGRDVFNFKQKDDEFDNSIDWGNTTTSLRWNHLFNSKLFLNTSVIFNDYKFNFGATENKYEFKLYSGVRDWNAKLDFNYFPSVKHNIKFGGIYIFHTFVPNNVTGKTGDTELDLGNPVELYSNDAALYINDDFDVSDKIKINAGLRYTYFQQIGPFDRYVKNELGEISDTIHYKKNKNVKTYNHIEPRLSLRYSINNLSSIKASWTQNYQYIHLASMSAVSLPTDIWMPSSSNIKPQFGTQYSIGYFRNFQKNMFESSLEIYYKEMRNQIEFKNDAMAEESIKDNIDNSFTFGDGTSYGTELFIKKKTGKITGWIGYTLSKTTKIFPEINQGKEFYAKYDRRHDVSVVVSYELNEKWIFSALWVYATGNAMTLPVARYFIEDNVVNEYGEKNAFRMPAYHRMDVSATYTVKKTKKIESTLNFSIYNLYNRYNPYYIYFTTTGDLNEYQLETKAKQVSLFSILPSVTWNFKF
jgi:hypothetical protein